MNPIDVIDCNFRRPDWPFMPVRVPCGSARTIAVVGPAAKCGIEITGYSIRVTNADGVSLSRTCAREAGRWVATFPASHFEHYGTVKNGVAVFASGKDENGNSQNWILRVGDLDVFPIDASGTPGSSEPKDTYHKSEIVDGVQHYKRETLTYSERQRAWGAEFEGDYVFVNGDFVPFSEGD